MVGCVTYLFLGLTIGKRRFVVQKKYLVRKEIGTRGSIFTQGSICKQGEPRVANQCKSFLRFKTVSLKFGAANYSTQLVVH